MTNLWKSRRGVGDVLDDGTTEGPIIGDGQPTKDPRDGPYGDINGNGERDLFDAFDLDGGGAPETVFAALQLYNEIF